MSTHNEGVIFWMDEPRDEHNRLHGARLTRYPDNRLFTLQDFVAGVPHGDWHRWFADGSPWEYGVYRAGQRDGAWRQWRRPGELACVVTLYDQGVLMIRYDEAQSDYLLWLTCLRRRDDDGQRHYLERE